MNLNSAVPKPENENQNLDSMELGQVDFFNFEANVSSIEIQMFHANQKPHHTFGHSKIHIAESDQFAFYHVNFNYNLLWINIQYAK